MHGSTKAFCVCLALAWTLIATAARGDCDMISIMVPYPQTITDIDALGSQYPHPFDEPSDFWTWYKNIQIPRNSNGYAIIYYRLVPDSAEHVYEWPELGHPLSDWANYDNNQVFRYEIQSTSNTWDCFPWAEKRIWETDGLDHYAYMVLAHTRRASGGNNGIDDPHPFIWDYAWDGSNEPQGDNTDTDCTYSLQHNGTLTDKQKLRDMTRDLWASWNPGPTWAATYPYKTENQGNNELVDSEALFHWVVCNIKLAGDTEEGLRRALIGMKDWDCYKNFVFADAIRMFAYRGYGSLTADSDHELAYRVNDTPHFFAVSTGKSGDSGLYSYATKLSNHQAVEFDRGDWVIVHDNFDQPQYHSIPYTSCDFENSGSRSINSSWYLNTHDDDVPYGDIQVEDAGGNHYLRISNTPGQTTQAEASMHVDLNHEARIMLEFSFMTRIGPPTLGSAPAGAKMDLDPMGVYFSDDGGETFSYVYALSGPHAVWQPVALDVDAICLVHGLERSSTFVVKFVFTDNDPVYNNSLNIDDVEIYSDPGGVGGTETGRTDDSGATGTISILGVVPNPGDASTRVRFASKTSSPLSLEIYSVTGELVRSQDLGTLGPGSHSVLWDGCDDTGAQAGAGIYYVRVSGSASTSHPVKAVLIH
jgi:predicted glutamine amidotransferase